MMHDEFGYVKEINVPDETIQTALAKWGTKFKSTFMVETWIRKFTIRPNEHVKRNYGKIFDAKIKNSNY